MKSVRWFSGEPIWKINFCSRVLQLSKLPKCMERPQSAICCLERLGRLKCLATGLNVSLSFFVVSFTNLQLFAISTSYTENDIGRGARKVISDLNGSLGSRRFLYVMNQGTSFASWVSAFESCRLIIGLKWTSDQQLWSVVVRRVI